MVLLSIPLSFSRVIAFSASMMNVVPTFVAIAEPYLANKAKDGKYWVIRQCVGCNQGCFDHIFKMKPVECMRNYEASREGKFFSVKKAKIQKRF